jgi:hypothetical protein
VAFLSIGSPSVRPRDNRSFEIAQRHVIDPMNVLPFGPLT